MGFPTYRYHREQGCKLVKTADEEAALGEGWEDNPGKVGLIPCEKFGHMTFDKDPNFKPLHKCKPGESYHEHQEGFKAKDEGAVDPDAEAPVEEKKPAKGGKKGKA